MKRFLRISTVLTGASSWHFPRRYRHNKLSRSA